jgi:hypothetical protein
MVADRALVARRVIDTLVRLILARAHGRALSRAM